jgi:hypothetical protein
MDQPTSTGHETHIRPNITQHTWQNSLTHSNQMTSCGRAP